MPKEHPTTFRTAEGQEETRPAYIYIVDYNGDLIHLTGHDADITVTGLPVSKGADPELFVRTGLSHSAIEQTSELGANRMQMTMPVKGNAMADQLRQLLLVNAPQKLTVTIVRVNSESLPGPILWGEDTYVVFKGIGTSLAFRGSQMVVGLVSVLLDATGRVPRVYWQKRCQHPLYGQGVGSCHADPEAAANRLETEVLAIDARARTVDIPDTLIDGEAIEALTFQGGLLKVYEDDSYTEPPLDVITVMTSSMIGGGGGTRLYLHWWSANLIATQPVKVLRGCRRIMEDCVSFPRTGETDPSTRINFFGGMPWIPDFSPSAQGIR